MPRVLWFSVQLLCLLLNCLWDRYVSADCWYNNERYREGREVTTAEPCLNCTCLKSTLVCYLRVCPKLPNPPPPECILLYRHKACCPELICRDAPISTYYIEGRSEVDEFDLLDRRYVDNACFINGTVYAPGSAMDSSTFCEYCYCLGGKERCVKPKCLLPLEGCTPVYTSNSCCPVHYNCSNSYFKTSTTTTSPEILQGNCLVAGKLYPKGHKVLGVGHSACDNCYCIRGLVRCEPLSCAPPLLGCLPVIKQGECCAASYNCSGTIETRPVPNYGNFPIMSKEYAKFRKEATGGAKKNSLQGAGSTISTTKSHRLSGSYGTTRHFVGNALDRSTTKPYLNFKSTSAYPEVVYISRSEENKITSEEMKNNTKNYLHSNAKVKDSRLNEQFESRINTRIDNITEAITSTVDLSDITSTTESHLIGDSTTELMNQTNPTEDDVTMLASTIIDLFTQEFFSDSAEEEDATELGDEKSTTTDYSTTLETTTSDNLNPPVTLKTVINTTDCIEGVYMESAGDPEKKIANESLAKSGNLTLGNDVTTVDLESKVNVSTATVVPLEKFAPSLLTLGKDKESYDYDDKPTLPPSLPNLIIIPFLPSDALDAKKKQDDNKRYPLLEERATDSNIYTFTSRFSPPSETIGGFVPKTPDDIYGNKGNTVTSVPALPITKQPKTEEESCLSEGFEIQHGEAVTSKNVCIVCVCYYGDIICQDPQCPPVKKGCRKSSILDRSTCCPRIICEDDDPQNLIIDHIEITSNPKDVITVAEGIVSQDPFKDVIRTEPAPNLQTLIGDLPEYIRRQTQNITSNASSSVTQESTTKTPTTTSSESSLEELFQMIFSGDNDDKTTIMTTEAVLETLTEATNGNKVNETSENDTNNLVNTSDPSGVGPLKLAGCNIYGRMYRVGKIISELSGPCLECKCTEVGVQCGKLC